VTVKSINNDSLLGVFDLHCTKYNRYQKISSLLDFIHYLKSTPFQEKEEQRD